MLGGARPAARTVLGLRADVAGLLTERRGSSVRGNQRQLETNLHLLIERLLRGSEVEPGSDLVNLVNLVTLVDPRARGSEVEPGSGREEVDPPVGR